MDHSGSYVSCCFLVSCIVNGKRRNKIYKPGKVDDRIQILQSARSRNKRQKEPRYESRNVALNHAQKVTLKNSRFILEWL